MRAHFQLQPHHRPSSTLAPPSNILPSSFSGKCQLRAKHQLKSPDQQGCSGGDIERKSAQLTCCFTILSPQNIFILKYFNKDITQDSPFRIQRGEQVNIRKNIAHMVKTIKKIGVKFRSKNDNKGQCLIHYNELGCVAHQGRQEDKGLIMGIMNGNINVQMHHVS